MLLPPNVKAIVNEIQKTIEKASRAADKRSERTDEQQQALISTIQGFANQIVTQEQQRAAKEEEKETREKRTIAALWTAAAFTLLLAGIAACQLEEMKKAYGPLRDSADAALASERPYVFTTVPKIEVSAKGKTITYTLTNYGKTPAILRYYTARSFNKNSPPTDTEIWNGWEVLRTGESHTGKSIEVRNVPLKTGDIGSSGDSAKNVTSFFWLEFFYVDVFNFVHTSTATFFYLDDGKSPRYVQIAGEKYNDHRIEKMPEGEWHPNLGKPPKVD